MKARARTYTKPWSASFQEFFDLVGPDWRPPEDALVTVNAKRDRLTITAVFARPDGLPVTLSCVARKDRDGDWTATRETLRIRMVTRVGDIHVD